MPKKQRFEIDELEVLVFNSSTEFDNQRRDLRNSGCSHFIWIPLCLYLEVFLSLYFDLYKLKYHCQFLIQKVNTV